MDLLSQEARAGFEGELKQAQQNFVDTHTLNENENTNIQDEEASL